MPPEKKKEVPPPPPSKEAQEKFDYKTLVIAPHVSAENKEKELDSLGAQGFRLLFKDGETYFFSRLYK